MVSDFPRVLTLLRKEKGISQKKAAADLGISQALLSHYEKGIRECGLNFLVNCADYYQVSCDYLLGRSANRQGETITAEELPDASSQKDNQLGSSVLPTLNKKLLYNSIHIIYGLLAKYNSKSLTEGVSDYLSLAVYKMFRLLYDASSGNSAKMFRLSEDACAPLSDAAQIVCETRLKDVCKGEKGSRAEKEAATEVFSMTTEQLNALYPQAATSLLNLIKKAEEQIQKGVQ